MNKTPEQLLLENKQLLEDLRGMEEWAHALERLLLRFLDQPMSRRLQLEVLELKKNGLLNPPSED